jgi:hypothetical protein
MPRGLITEPISFCRILKYYHIFSQHACDLHFGMKGLPLTFTKKIFHHKLIQFHESSYVFESKAAQSEENLA